MPTIAVWDISLSPTTLGNIRFAEVSGIYDLTLVHEGDLVYIYGSEFASSMCQGVFEIAAVHVSYSGVTLVQWFEIVNPAGVAQAGVIQTAFKDLMFFRPVRRTVYDAPRHVIVSQTGPGVDIVMPATTQVSREPGQAAYLQEPTSIELLSLKRTNGSVAGATLDPHGLSVGDSIIIDGARSDNTRPAITSGTPSTDYSSDVASGTTDYSLQTTASTGGTFRGFGHKAMPLSDGMVLVVGGLVNSYTPIASPSVLEITSETLNPDGSRQEAYKWTLLSTHTATTGHREFGASTLLDGRVLVTGGTDGKDVDGASNDKWNLFTYTRSPVQDTMVAGNLPGVRAGHAQVSMQDGGALIIGGWVVNHTPIATTRYFNPTTTLWSNKASLNKARMRHRAVTLQDGTVLVMGGQSSATVTLNTCEIYNPGTNTWTYTGAMSIGRYGFEAVLLADGRVLVIGGIGYNPTQSTTNSAQETCEIYDPSTRLWSPAPPISIGRVFMDVGYVPSENAVYVTAGNTNNTAIERLDVTKMKWSKLGAILSGGGGTTWGTGAVIGDDIFVSIGGSNVGSITFPSTPKRNTFVVPGQNTFGGSGLNGLHEVLTVPSATTFTYSTPDQPAYSVSVAGATVSPVAAAAGIADVPGPFTYDMEHGAAITAVDAALVSELKSGQRYQSLEVDDATEFPDETGYLVFNFGQTEQVAPVKYLGRLSNTELALDASFKFPFDVPAGSDVVLLEGRSPWQPAANERPGNFYVTGSAAGRIAAMAAVDDTAAAGIDVRKTIVYPSDAGLGGEGRPSSGAPKLSDKVAVWGGDNLDAEIEAARSQS